MLQMRVLRRVPHPLHVLHVLYVCMRSPGLETLGTRRGPILMGHPATCALRLWRDIFDLDHFFQQICVMYLMVGKLGTRWGLFFVGQDSIRATGIAHRNEVLP